MKFGSLRENYKVRFSDIKGFTVAVFVTVLLFLPFSCSKKNEEFYPNFKDRAKVPGMYTDSSTTLISDSGRIRYKIYTVEWIVYDKAKEPYWFFPRKLHFEQFNKNFIVESVFDCDTARYFVGRRVWEFKKNVRVVNRQGEMFETQILYWDQRQEKIYTDSFITIDQKKMTLTGYGFNSNQTFTKYNIIRPSGPFDMDSETPDSMQMDPTYRQNATTSSPAATTVVGF